jgi:predicted nucleic acid-binding protein
MRTIIDTGPLVAYLCARDEYHAWSVATLDSRERPLLTCEAVLAETVHRLNYFEQETSAVFELLREKALIIGFELEIQLESVGQLMAKYAGRRIDLADACLIRLSELYPSAQVVTLDQADFRVYRRGDRKMIPFLTPPARG